MELNGEPVPIELNVNDFFSVGSEDAVTGEVLGGPPKVKPTGLPMLPPEVPGLVTDEDAPKVNFVPVDGKPPNGDGAVLSLSKLVLPKRLVVGGDVGTPNPPNGPAAFSVFMFPNPPNTPVVGGFSDALDRPEKGDGVGLSFSSSSLRPNSGVVDGPPNKVVVLVGVDAPRKDPEDVELEVKLPNMPGLALFSWGSPIGFFASEEAKKFGMVGEGLLSELVELLKPNVGAGGPPDDSEVRAGVEGSEKPVDGFKLSLDVGNMKLLGFEPTEGVLELSEGLDPGVL